MSAAVADLELPVLDYTDPTLSGEPLHREVRALAQRNWIAAGPLGYCVLEREAAEFWLRTRDATFPGMKIAELFGITSGPLYEEMRRNILHIDGADHRRLRSLVNPAFTPRAADRWRPAMREFLVELMPPGGACEFVGAVAKPYPSRTIATVMGAPLDDAPRLHEWSNLIQGQFDAHALMTNRPAIERAVEEFYAWSARLIAHRRETPSDDLISTLIAAHEGGDRLSDVELQNLVLNVLVGGVDTTQSQLAHALRLFALHPSQWELLRERPELVPAAVEEVLRFEPITPFTARIALRDVEYRDVRFPAGTVVLVAAVAANRQVEPDGEAFDVTVRRPRSKPLTFGAGIHYCLGANLARAELQEALAFLAPRMPGLELAGEPQLGTVTGVYGVERLPLRWRAAG